MGVYYESQVYARCDSCGTNDACSQCTVAIFKQMLRREGGQSGRKRFV